MAYLYILGTILCTVYSQIIIKARINLYGPLPDLFADKAIFLLKLFRDPFILSGLVAVFFSGLCWMAAMTKFELSYAYPFIVGGLTIIIGLLSVILFKEPITLNKVMGIILIVAGIIFMIRQ